MSPRAYTTPRPFLKWVGGKGQLIPQLLAQVEKAEPFGRYHEPFVGGGALFFEFFRARRLTKYAWLSDNNERLVETYAGVRQDVEQLIKLLKAHKKNHCEEYYYQVRAKVPDTLIERAARIIYHNKTCYNGLYRENSKGEFNSPFGRYKNPTVCDEDNLRAVSQALGRAKVEHRPFKSVLKRAKRNDFVYFDPPYHPVSKSASFTSYNKGGFGEEAQIELADVFNQLTKMGVKALLSNSMTDFVKDLYSGHKIIEVQAKRTVNSRADRRGKISEALIRNF